MQILDGSSDFLRIFMRAILALPDCEMHACSVARACHKQKRHPKVAFDVAASVVTGLAA